MAKAAALIISTFCLLAFAGVVHCQQQPDFYVSGKVYCDTCRVQFETRISQPIKGAIVTLDCRNRDNGTIVTLQATGMSDEEGNYKMPVKGDYEKDICEVAALKSPWAECSEPMQGLNKARISLTGNNGIRNTNRHANPIGFMKAEPLPECTEVLDELGFFPITE